MDNECQQLLESKKSNIGALCGFLKSPKNKECFDYLKSKINNEILKYNLPLSELLYYYFNNIKQPILCSCGIPKKYIGFKNGYRTSCGKKECYVRHRKQTCLDKYGVDNPKKSKAIISKEQENIRKKYNGKHYMEDKLIREKFNKSMESKYGVQWAQQSPEILEKTLKKWETKSEEELQNISNEKLRIWNDKTPEDKEKIKQKRKQTITEKYGSVSDMYQQIQQKIKLTSQEKYGVDHFFKDPKVINKRINSYKHGIINKYLDKLGKYYQIRKTTYNENNTDSYFHLHHTQCQEIFKITRQLLNKRLGQEEELCLHCNPISSGYSKLEKEILQFIQDNYPNKIRENDTSLGFEIDILIPDLKLGIEVNGNYWHSELYKDSKFHLNKTNNCEDQGYQLIHIFEDEWLYKQDIVKSRLLNLLGQSRKIYARKCKVKEITDNQEIRSFLEQNHLQGFVGSKVKLGLYYQNKLVSLMTFGNLRKNLGQKKSKKSFELLRFCNSLNTSVIGGASKLFKHFLRNYQVENIISYADRRWSQGQLYQNLGFEYSHSSYPNYFYCHPKELIRLNRFNFRKDRLISEGYSPELTEREIMFQRGYLRIYDCGNLVYNFKNIS